MLRVGCGFIVHCAKEAEVGVSCLDIRLVRRKCFMIVVL